MNTVGACGQGHVDAGVDEESRPLLAAGGQLPRAAESFNCLARQLLQFAGGKILFAKLDIVHAIAGGFGDFLEQLAAARGLVPGKRGAVSDVVEQQRFGLASGLRDLGQDFAFFFRRAPEMVFGESIPQELESILR